MKRKGLFITLAIVFSVLILAGITTVCVWRFIPGTAAISDVTSDVGDFFDGLISTVFPKKAREADKGSESDSPMVQLIHTVAETGTTGSQDPADNEDIFNPTPENDRDYYADNASGQTSFPEDDAQFIAWKGSDPFAAGEPDPFSEDVFADSASAEQPSWNNEAESYDPFAEDTTESYDPFAEEEPGSFDPFAEEEPGSYDSVAEYEYDPFAEEEQEYFDPFAEEEPESGNSFTENETVDPENWETESNNYDPFAFDEGHNTGTTDENDASQPVAFSVTVSDPVYLAEPRQATLSPNQKIPIYTAPSTKSLRTKSGKAVCKTDQVVRIYGEVDNWLMVSAMADSGKPRVGYIQSSKTKGSPTDIAPLNFSFLYGGVCRDTALFEAPDRDSESITNIAFGTELTYLATEGDWAYVETTVKKKTCRGFIPRKDVLLKRGRKLDPSYKCASDYLDSDYDLEKAFDGDTETSYQYRGDDQTDFYLTFGFGSPVSPERMVIHNGFWRVTEKKDQYTRNGRLETVEISFLYGDADTYADPMRITLPETKDWDKRKDGIYVDLSGHDNVTAIKLVPVFVRKGSYFKRDIAISEIAFYSAAE